MNSRRNRSQKAWRAKFHDYTSAGLYHITITAYPGTPRLSEIHMPPKDYLQKNEMIIPANTELGEYVKEELLAMARKEPRLMIRRYVIMPDHIHFILQVLSKLEKPIGKYIAPFTAACSKTYNSLYNLPSFKTLFQPFDDEIIFTPVQLDRTMKYIQDNPRRHLLRRKHPDLFKRHLDLTLEDHVYSAYGNIFLLRERVLLPVRIHRYWSESEFDQYAAKCHQAIDAGAIPITPAIHKAEKAIVKYAFDTGASVILLRDLGFNERFKPEGEYFDLCAAGRLLLLAPWPENLDRSSGSGYTEFHKMNDLALTIASLPSSARLSIRLSSNI